MRLNCFIDRPIVSRYRWPDRHQCSDSFALLNRLPHASFFVRVHLKLRFLLAMERLTGGWGKPWESRRISKCMQIIVDYISAPLFHFFFDILSRNDDVRERISFRASVFFRHTTGLRLEQRVDRSMSDSLRSL